MHLVQGGKIQDLQVSCKTAWVEGHKYWPPARCIMGYAQKYVQYFTKNVDILWALFLSDNFVW